MARVTKIGNKMGPSTDDQYMLKLMTETQPLGGLKRPYASNVALCPRKNWLFKFPTEELSVNEAESTAYMGFGNGFEEALYTRMRNKGKAFLSNPYLPYIADKWDGINVGGKIDIIGWDKEDKLAFWEVKTCGALPTSPKIGHLRQAQTYAILAGLDTGYVFYQSRNVKDWKSGEVLIRTFKVDTSWEALKPIVENIFFTFMCLENEAMPPKPPDMVKSHCGFCPHQSLCWSRGGQSTYVEMDIDDVLETRAKAAERALAYWEWRPYALQRLIRAHWNDDDVRRHHGALSTYL